MIALTPRRRSALARRLAEVQRAAKRRPSTEAYADLANPFGPWEPEVSVEVEIHTTNEMETP